jgi:diguanylate cyclase (GGDEF)-like protein
VETKYSRQRKPYTLLVVDDQPNNIKVLFDFLVESGYRVLVAQDGESALEKAANAVPHLVLLDVMMPGIDGFETCRRLKLNEKTKDIPVIFMTALSDTPYSVKGFEVGAVDYVTKPIQQEEILARINTQLTIRKMYLELEEKTRVLDDKNTQLERELLERQRGGEALRKANKMLYRLATVDGLTQVPNRRFFDDAVSQEWQRAVRASTSLSLILCDIDYFKRYNDEYGHQKGDECLKRVAKTIESAVKRATDLVARYGGEEFVVLLPDVDAAGALKIARQIQQKIQDLSIAHTRSDVDEFITLSMGVATMAPTQEIDPDHIIAVADKALYAAKAQGRNRIVPEIEN